jgi:hypothetical protein
VFQIPFCRFLILFFLFLNYNYFSQKNKNPIDSIIKSDRFLKKTAQAKKKHKVQIIYTQINRDANNVPTFKNYTFALDSNNYFYPASTVKLPTSIFALEKINALDIQGLNRQTTMLTDSANICQKTIWVDSSSQNGRASLEHYIKKMLLVSDNNAFSRVFEFVNPKLINSRLAELGHPTARIVHRLDPACAGKGNRYYNPVRFVNNNYELLYSQAADSLNNEFEPSFKVLLLGKNIYGRKKKIISQKKDFSKSNYLSLMMIHQTLRNLAFWDFMPEHDRFKITKDDQQFLMKYLGMYPKESDYPKYDTSFFHDSFKKYLIYGAINKLINVDSLRIFNIVGRAYGFQIDCAYIVDFESKTEFMLSTVIYTNKRNSFGSGNYEYEVIGLPFLKELSLALYRFEKNRKKKNLPNLNSVNFYKTP